MFLKFIISSIFIFVSLSFLSLFGSCTPQAQQRVSGKGVFIWALKEHTHYVCVRGKGNCLLFWLPVQEYWISLELVNSTVVLQLPHLSFPVTLVSPLLKWNLLLCCVLLESTPVWVEIFQIETMRVAATSTEWNDSTGVWWEWVTDWYWMIKPWL